MAAAGKVFEEGWLKISSHSQNRTGHLPLSISLELKLSWAFP